MNYDRTTTSYQNLITRAATHQFTIGADERMRIDSSGRVGIGTTSPGKLLTVHYDAPAYDTVDDVLRLVNKFTSTNNAASALAGSGPSIVFAGGIGDNQTRDRARIVAPYEGSNVSGLAFHTQNTADIITEKMRIQNNGNVGIGTTSPQKKLEVTGDLQLDADNASIWLKSGIAGTAGKINWTYNSEGTVYASAGIDYDTRASTGFHLDVGYPITLDTSSSTGIKFITATVQRAVINNSGLSVTGNIAVSGTVDGVDIAARDGVLTSTTTTANAALPKAGGTMTGNLTIQNGSPRVLLTETGVTNTPTWWSIADGGNYNIRLNNTGVYPLDIVTNSTNDAVIHINVGYNTNFAAGIDVTGNITVSGTVDGRDVAADGTKLDTIETNATADQTAAQLLTAIKTVDGTGSGLDADLLDGQQGSYYMPASTTAINQSNQVSGSSFATTSSPGNVLEYQQANGLTDTKLAPGTDWYNSIRMGHGNPYSYYSNTIAVKMTGSGVGTLYTQTISNNVAQGWNKHWHENNDGSGSGLDADLLDGQQGSYYQKKTTVQDAAPSGATGDLWYESDTGSFYVYYSGAWVDVAPGVETNTNLQINSLGVGTAASGTAGEIRATNDVTAYYSDERLKDFHGNIDSALDKVNQLNGYYFTENETAKELGYDNDKRQVGVSAQEVQAVLPEVVAAAPISDEYLTVKYEKLAPLFIEAIKEIDKKYQDKIDILMEEIEKLKGN
jgi:hypothetical protein